MRIGISIREVVINEKESYILYKRYIEYFKEDEIILILPNQSEEVLSLCDAFILTGGDDLNPNLYNQENIKSNNVNDILDKLDFKIIEHCVNENKKLLGICRGIQSINVYFNGSLIQDFSNHMNTKHCITKKNESILDLDEIVYVNSFHHQIIGELADDLIATYISDDNVVEILEHQNKKIIGVQFHPEIDFSKYSKKIFNFIKNKY